MHLAILLMCVLALMGFRRGLGALGCLVGFKLFDCNLQLAQCGSADVVGSPAHCNQDRSGNNQNSQIHRSQEENRNLAFQQSFSVFFERVPRG